MIEDAICFIGQWVLKLFVGGLILTYALSLIGIAVTSGKR